MEKFILEYWTRNERVGNTQAEIEEYIPVLNKRTDVKDIKIIKLIEVA